MSAAPGTLSVDRDVSREMHHPSDNREPEKLSLSYPLHFPGEVADERYISERLMVGDDDVRKPRIFDHFAADVKPPGRIGPRERLAQPTEEVSRSVSDGITIKEPAQPHQGEPYQDEDYGREPSDERANQGLVIGNGRE